MPSYLVYSKLVKERGEAAKYSEGHRQYLAGLKGGGKIEFGYRFVDGSGGFYVIAAASLEEAEGVAQNDPYHTQGVREYTVREIERRL